MVSRTEPPDEDPVQFGITKGQNRFVAVEGAHYFIKNQAQRFGHAAIHFQQSRELSEKFLFSHMPALAAAKERHTHASRKRSRGEGNPGEHIFPCQWAVQSGSHQQGKRHNTCENHRASHPPANADRQCDEQIQEPEGNNRLRQKQECGKSGQIERQR